MEICEPSTELNNTGANIGQFELGSLNRLGSFHHRKKNKDFTHFNTKPFSEKGKKIHICILINE